MNTSNREMKQIVKSNLERMGSLSLDEITEIIRPHCDFNVHRLIEAELRREARRIIGSFMDANGAKIYCADSGSKVKNTEVK